MDERAKARILIDTNVQVPLVLTVGTGLWKLLSIWSDVDFLLSIREQKFALIFDLFTSSGWIIVLAIGLVWFVIRWFYSHGGEPRGAAT